MCTNPNCKAKKCSTHTMANCYWPGGGKEGQFPPNFGQWTKANVVNIPHCETTEHFVISAQSFAHNQTSGKSGILIEDDKLVIDMPISLIACVSGNFTSFSSGATPTFMDSGASDTMFISRNAFIEYRPITLWTGDSAKAVDGNFEIVGEGKVIQCYMVEGKEKKITYTHALHTPTLNMNLISISAFDKAGLTTTFGGGRGIIHKADGTVV